jgi:hypothetical protein
VTAQAAPSAPLIERPAAAPRAQPPALAGEFVVTKVGTDQYAPKATVRSQPVQLLLNGSGTLASAYTIGDRYAVAMSGSLADGERSKTGVFSVRQDPNNAGAVLVAWHDWIDHPSGRRLESHYLGWTYRGGPLNLITERRLVALVAWIKANYPNLSPTAWRVGGGSMGAWGSLRFGLHHPELFGSIMASRPRWKVAGAGNTKIAIPDWESQSGLEYAPAAMPKLSDLDGAGSSLPHMDLLALVADPAKKTPWIGWCDGRRDPYVEFSENVAAVAALRANKRPFAFVWNDGDHGTGDILSQLTSTYGINPAGTGMPYLSDSSRDQDPAKDLVGGINVGFAWRNVVETASNWSCEISNKLGMTTVTVEPHSDVFKQPVRPMTVNIPAGQWVTVGFHANAPPAPPPRPSTAQASLMTLVSAAPSSQVLPVKVVLNPAQQILFAAWQRDEQAYDREDSLLPAEGVTTSILFRGANAQAGGADRVLLGSRYRLLLNGTERAAMNVPAGAKKATFTVNLSSLPEGWYVMIVEGGTTETCAPWCFYRFAAASAKIQQEKMPVIQTSHDVDNRNKGAAIFMASVPAAFEPTIVPAPVRETPAFSDPTMNRSRMIQYDLVPWRPSALYRTRVTRGVLHPYNQEAYYWATMAANRYPAVACLDGPRGKGTVGMCTHLQVGRNSVYFSDPWRWGKITADGTVVTLAGYRHKSPPPRLPAGYTDAQVVDTLELVGNWDAIPPARRGFHEAWGFAWDERTLVSDNNAKPIPNNGILELPHVHGPRGFVADSQLNRIVLLTFKPTTHDLPVVTEFLTGLAEPWDCVCAEGVLYVSERKAHRITAYDATSGKLIRVVTKGAALAELDQSRFVQRNAPLDQIRAQPCVLPEGLALQDGWLYFGSIAMGQVRRVSLKSGAMETIVSDIKEYSRGGTNFCKIAVSDGTFGPRGTVFFVTWSIANQGRPRAFFPDGTEWSWAGVGADLSGPGRPWETLGYGSAVGVGQGKLVCGYSTEGITQISKALPSDITLKDPADQRGASNDYWRLKILAAYDGAGFDVTHGPGGYGYFGLPLPWGINAEIDTYLKTYGHTRQPST